MSVVPGIESPLCRAGHEEPSVIAGYSAAVARALEHRGIDSGRALRAAGLAGNASNDPLERITVSQVTTLYQVCVALTDDPYFGLSVGRFIQATNVHALGYALMASRTLWDFCLRLERYFAIVSQSLVMRVERRGAEVTVRLSIRTEPCGETEDAFLSFVLGFMRLLYGKTFAPLRVGMHRVCPRQGPEPYLRDFGVTPTFGQDDISLVFCAAALDEPLAGACPDLAEFNDRIAAQCLARLNRQDVVAQVRAAIVERLPTGRCTRGQVARELGLSEAALQQKLGERGQCFQDLLDEIRRELALGYLAQPGLAITEIAFLLGFADASNFTRAFRRWHSISPTQFRSQRFGG